MSIATDALKVPPHDIDAERSVLGAILIDPSSLHLVSEFLHPDYFYLTQHQMVFGCMIKLFEQQQPIDVVTLKSQLQKEGQLKTVGGTSFLSDLINAVPTSANIEHYGLIVKGHHAKRKLIELSSRIVEKAFDERADVKNLLDSAESEIFAISQASTHRDFIELKDILTESFERLEAFSKEAGGMRGVPTGYVDLDNKLAGMQNANLIILAARPGVGKTSLALNIALNASTKYKMPVGFFSLEMSKEELVDRLLVSHADIDAWKLKTGRLSDEDLRKLTESMGELSQAPIFIDDTPGISILEMRSKARKLKAEKGLRFLVVDYLQLADAGKKLESRVQEVSYVSQGLKNLARELQIPVLSLSQLSRMVEQRNTKKPQLSDLRESGAIEQDADVVMFIYSEVESTDELNVTPTRPYKLLIAKHRNGSVGEIDLMFRGDRVKFYSVEKNSIDSL